MNKNFSLNNFDLIRLLAALEVAIIHTSSHLDIDINFIKSLLHYIPGVPIFFFVSGFLISKSYENSKTLKNYSINRFLRIFPGLFLVSVVGVISVYFTGYFSDNNVKFNEIATWFLAQITFVQFYNPDFMRDFGVGVLNGSLWTISVELQFYFLVPVLYTIFNLAKTKNSIPIYVLIVCSMLIHFFYYEYRAEYEEVFLYKLLGVSFIPWIYMFLVGIVFQKNFDLLYKLLKGKFLLILFAYILFVNIADFRMSNAINPILFIMLSVLIFSFAFSYENLSAKALKGNDISYGVYIYHMVIVNLFVYYGFVNDIIYLLSVVFLSFAIGYSSWKFYEKPILSFKKKTIHKV